MTNAQSVMGGMVWMAIAGLLMLGALRPEQEEAGQEATQQVASANTADAPVSA